MTNNVYRTAQGKLVDMGALQLKNETVRAVGNMGVNARGDRVDETNRVIDPRANQVQRQVKRTTNVVSAEVQTSSLAAQKAKREAELNKNDIQPLEETPIEAIAPQPVIEDPVAVVAEESIEQPTEQPTGGLAAALARAKSK